jgi:hypothetical protein
LAASINRSWRAFIYEHFFQAPFVKQFMDQEGIEEATPEAARRRCPFLLNLLASVDALETERQSVTIKTAIVLPQLIRPYAREDAAVTLTRLRALKAAWPNQEQLLAADDLSILRELFGQDFLSDAYPIKQALFIEEL